jgi:hypothetical protein
VFLAKKMENRLRKRKITTRLVWRLFFMTSLFFLRESASQIKKRANMAMRIDAKSIPAVGLRAIWKGRYRTRRKSKLVNLFRNLDVLVDFS